jgi:DNA (cytosine-5)-methyltransferase 1
MRGIGSGLLPTPKASDGAKATRTAEGALKELHRGRNIDLGMVAKLWPTPTKVTSTGGTALCKWGGSRSREKLKTMVTPEELNGALNPAWVEWLMGFPIGWTELEASETPSSRKSRK